MKIVLKRSASQTAVLYQFGFLKIQKILFYYSGAILKRRRPGELKFEKKMFLQILNANTSAILVGNIILKLFSFFLFNILS